jgi:hypothetical protein
LGKTNNQDFKITIDGTIFDERVKAGERLMLLPKLEDWKDKDTPLSVGEYRGIQISIEHATSNSVEFVLKGSHNYRGDLGISELDAVVRIENAVEHIPKMLEKEKQQLDNYIRQLEETPYYKNNYSYNDTNNGHDYFLHIFILCERGCHFCNCCRTYRHKIRLLWTNKECSLM